jgi:hypothetical protein
MNGKENCFARNISPPTSGLKVKEARGGEEEV